MIGKSEKSHVMTMSQLDITSLFTIHYFVGDILNFFQRLWLFQFLPDNVAVRQSNSVVDFVQNLCSRLLHYMYQHGIYLTVKKKNPRINK